VRERASLYWPSPQNGQRGDLAGSGLRQFQQKRVAVTSRVRIRDGVIRRAIRSGARLAAG
jgi:hypothetical protein